MLTAVAWSCGPGINVDAPDMNAVPDNVNTSDDVPEDTSLEGTAEPPEAAPSDTQRSLPDAGAATPPADSDATATTLTAPTASSLPQAPELDAGETPPAASEAPTASSSENPPASSEPATDPPGLLPPMPSTTTVPPPSSCGAEPWVAPQRTCEITELEQDNLLSIDLSADLTAYNSDELQVTPTTSPPPDWLFISVDLTGSKRVEVLIDWSKAPDEGQFIRLSVARKDDSCAIVEVPVLLAVGSRGNDCMRLQ